MVKDIAVMAFRIVSLHMVKPQIHQIQEDHVGWGHNFLFRWLWIQPYALLSAGFFFLARSKPRRVKLVAMLCWLVSAIVVFSIHRPLWHHYSLALSVPLALCAGVGFNGLLDHAGTTVFRVIAAGIFGLWILSMPFHLERNRRFGFDHDPYRLRYQEMIRLLKAEPGGTGKMMMTDFALLGFETRRPIIPELCVFSLKRVIAGSISDESVTLLLVQYQPDAVALMSPIADSFKRMHRYLKRHYREVTGKQGGRCYFRLSSADPR